MTHGNIGCLKIIDYRFTQLLQNNDCSGRMTHENMGCLKCLLARNNSPLKYRLLWSDGLEI